MAEHCRNITDADGMTNAVTFSYQWMHSENGVDTDIPGATRQGTYSPIPLSDLSENT